MKLVVGNRPSARTPLLILLLSLAVFRQARLQSFCGCLSNLLRRLLAYDPVAAHRTSVSPRAHDVTPTDIRESVRPPHFQVTARAPHLPLVECGSVNAGRSDRRPSQPRFWCRRWPFSDKPGYNRFAGVFLICCEGS
jgi:hypothetical protein